MRFATIAAAVVFISAVSVATTSSSFAQSKKGQLTVSQCIDLAMKRGYTQSDVDNQGSGKTNPARQFVIRCLQGKQR